MFLSEGAYRLGSKNDCAPQFVQQHILNRDLAVKKTVHLNLRSSSRSFVTMIHLGSMEHRKATVSRPALDPPLQKGPCFLQTLWSLAFARWCRVT